MLCRIEYRRGDTVQDQGSVVIETVIQVEQSKHTQASKFSTICFPVLESEWAWGSIFLISMKCMHSVYHTAQNNAYKTAE